MRKQIGSERRGFSLIELLIVVSIISVLAAIAVPSYIKAQVRANSSRVRSELRSAATALESYRVDHGLYPPPGGLYGQRLDSTTQPFAGLATRLSPHLTTPMGYLTIDYFVEPFIASNTTTEPQPYRYVTRDFLAAHDPQGLATYDRYIERVMSGSSRVIGYYMLSHGPDLTLNTPPSESAPVIRSFYDPTNGDMSNGDIVYFGDGMGFIH